MAQDEFSAALDRFIAAGKKELTRRVRRAGMEALRRIVMRTPVDTGCCRGNWRIGFGKIDRTFDAAARDRSGGPTVAAASARIASAVAGVDIFISNSTPYCPPLEYGYSRQNPAGMVRVTANEIQKLIERGVL